MTGPRGVRQGDTIDAAKLRLLWSESVFQREVIRLAEAHGWKAWHDVDSRRNVAGLPDLILVRGTVLWRELKAQKGKVSEEQLRFMARLQWAGQDAKVWRPSDWDEIERVLE